MGVHGRVGSRHLHEVISMNERSVRDDFVAFAAYGVAMENCLEQDSVNLRLSTQRALVGNVSANLAGLYATKEGIRISITAYFFDVPSEEDLQLTEEIAAEVVGDYTDALLETTNKLISDMTINTIRWDYLRAEAHER